MGKTCSINILLNTHFPGSVVEQINIPTNRADSCPTSPTQLDSLFTTQRQSGQSIALNHTNHPAQIVYIQFVSN